MAMKRPTLPQHGGGHDTQPDHPAKPAALTKEFERILQAKHCASSPEWEEWVERCEHTLHHYIGTHGLFAEPSWAHQIGLGQSQLWYLHPHKVFYAASSLLRKFPSTEKRSGLFKSTNHDPSGAKLINAILCCLVEDNPSMVKQMSARGRVDLSRHFLQLLLAPGDARGDLDDGSRQLPWNDLLHQAVHELKVALNQPQVNKVGTRRQIAVISMLFNVKHGRDRTLFIRPEYVHAGDEVAFTSDTALAPGNKTVATVTNVGFDADEGAHWVTLLDHSVRIQRVKIYGDADLCGDADLYVTRTVGFKYGPDYEYCIDKLIGTIVDHFEQKSWKTGLAELLHTLLFHLGDGSRKETLINLIESQLRLVPDAVDRADENEMSWMLKKLCFSLGCRAPGLFTLAITQLDSAVATSAFHSVLRREPKSTEFKCAQMMFVRLFLPVFMKAARIKGIEKRVGILTAFGRALLAVEHSVVFNDTTMAAIRLLYTCFEQDEIVAVIGDAAAAAAFAAIIGAFTRWSDDGPNPTWYEEGTCVKLFESWHNNATLEAALRRAVVMQTRLLVHKLFDKFRRVAAFRLLAVVARMGWSVLPDDTDKSFNSDTANRLKLWSADLIEEQAKALRDDVNVTGRWLSNHVMNEVESWTDDSRDWSSLKPDCIMGRLLVWSLVIETVDNGASMNFGRRPSFVAYLIRCKPLALLTLALLDNDDVLHHRSHGSEITGEPYEMGDLLTALDTLNIAQLQTHVLLRTFAVLPSLSQRWWKEGCAAVFQENTRDAVERVVTPRIWRGCVDRVRASVQDFGAMQVEADPDRRVVRAVYAHHSCSPIVDIVIPSSFPIGTVKVDCGQSRGVSASCKARWKALISRMLNDDGERLRDTLVHWKSTVEQELNEMATCPICLCLVEATCPACLSDNGQEENCPICLGGMQEAMKFLPFVTCSVCLVGVHSDCLDNWFGFDLTTTCVVCRRPWRETTNVAVDA